MSVEAAQQITPISCGFPGGGIYVPPFEEMRVSGMNHGKMAPLQSEFCPWNVEILRDDEYALEVPLPRNSRDVLRARERGVAVTVEDDSFGRDSVRDEIVAHHRSLIVALFPNSAAHDDGRKGAPAKKLQRPVQPCGPLVGWRRFLSRYGLYTQALLVANCLVHR